MTPFDKRYDLDLDGRVGFSDFVLFAMAFGEANADLREDPEYLDRQIKHISDPGLFAALDLDRSGLEDVKRAVEREDYGYGLRSVGCVLGRPPGV